MQYKRDFIPLKECTSGYGRGGMIPHGIARMETYGEEVKLKVNIYGLAPGAGPYSVYAMGVTDTMYRKISLGTLQPDTLGRCELGYRTTTVDMGGYQIRVLAVALQNGTEILTGYADGMVDWKRLQDADTFTETVQEAAEENAEMTEEATMEAAAEETVEEEADVLEIQEEPPMRHAESVQEEASPIISDAAAKDALEYMRQSYPRIYPFRNTETKWIRIHPRDMAPLPGDVAALEGSPFLQRGYLQYKHLILGYDATVYYLGVPFRYHQEQEEMAHTWGFQEFKNSFGTVPMKGDYGYWIRKMQFTAD